MLMCSTTLVQPTSCTQLPQSTLSPVGDPTLQRVCFMKQHTPCTHLASWADLVRPQRPCPVKVRHGFAACTPTLEAVQPCIVRWAVCLLVLRPRCLQEKEVQTHSSEGKKRADGCGVHGEGDIVRSTVMACKQGCMALHEACSCPILQPAWLLVGHSQ